MMPILANNPSHQMNPTMPSAAPVTPPPIHALPSTSQQQPTSQLINLINIPRNESSHRNRIDPPPNQINSPLQTMLILIPFNPSHPSIPANRIITPRKSNRATRQSNRATTVENDAAPQIFHPTLETGVTGKKRHGESVKRAKQRNENEQREKRDREEVVVVVGSVLVVWLDSFSIGENNYGGKITWEQKHDKV